MPKPALLVGNPTAQTGRAARWIKRAQEELAAVGIACEFMATEPAGKTVANVSRHIDTHGTTLVIAMGGDGTFAEVAKGILSARQPDSVKLGLLPIGTANDQGKSVGIRAGARAIKANVKILCGNGVVSMDAGRLTVFDAAGDVIHRDMFFDSFSVGLSGATLRARNRDRALVSRLPGLSAIYHSQAVYAGALLRRMLQTYLIDTKFDLVAKVDDHVWHYEALLDLVIKNTRVFSGDWVLDAATRSDDGLFEMTPILGRRDFLTKLVTTFRLSPLTEDRLRALGVEREPSRTGQRFELDVYGNAGRRIKAQVDGEEIPDGARYHIENLPRALHIVAPTS
ncbi:MAG: hypothetical protein IPL79_12035 [Myxococcales bacterium]|nr:hypothetical protein [Myxococcales bacterium]